MNRQGRHPLRDYPSGLREKLLLANASPVAVGVEPIDAIFKFGMSARLGRIRTPACVITSGNKVGCPPHHSERPAATIPQAERNIYKDRSHFLNLVYATPFNTDPSNADIRASIRRNE